MRAMHAAVARLSELSRYVDKVQSANSLRLALLEVRATLWGDKGRGREGTARASELPPPREESGSAAFARRAAQADLVRLPAALAPARQDPCRPSSSASPPASESLVTDEDLAFEVVVNTLQPQMERDCAELTASLVRSRLRGPRILLPRSGAAQGGPAEPVQDAAVPYAAPAQPPARPAQDARIGLSACDIVDRVCLRGWQKCVELLQDRKSVV